MSSGLTPFKLSMVVPIFNEEKNIEEFIRQSLGPIREVTDDFEIIFCMDPGTDQSENLILKLRKTTPEIKLLRFSRRFGQPMATLAGLSRATGQVAIVMDVDLQDPPSLIPEMVAQWRKGFDVVYAKRRGRQGETMIKRMIAAIGYRVIERISIVPIPRDTGDFRLLSRRVIDELLRLRETHGFLRGMVALVGFPQTEVLFDRPARHSGAGNYNRFTGSLLIGLNGVVGFSNQLLRLSTMAGIATLVLALIWAFTEAGLNHRWAMPILIFLSGLQLLSQGIQGAYLGRIYDEVRGRPKFIVDRAWGFE